MNDIDLVIYFVGLCPQLLFEPDNDGVVWFLDWFYSLISDFLFLLIYSILL
jgi:hypothetical protein